MSSDGFKNKKVVVTRPVERSESLAKIIRESNGQPVIVPTLELQFVKSEELLYIVKNIDEYDWIVFTSPAGVKSFFSIYKKDSIPSKIAVIGVKTEEILKKYNETPDLIPKDFTAEGLLESFASIDLKNKKIALPRTLSARTVLPEGLEEYGAEVTIAEAYTSSIPKDKTKIIKLMDDILSNEIDIITFTSPLTVHNLLKVIKNEKSEQYDEFLHKLQSEVIVGSIGPITGKALKQYNIPAIEANRYTVKDMIDALLQYI
ncbi:MAG: uroporphyrinogen-III synthase [Methanosphaera stadtmanae]|nr:uroporphyrinogen-III synthase [Methanosphaera stadtmanae]